MSTRQEVFDAINRERDYQDRKWGTVERNPHKLDQWIEIIDEEIGEAYDAMHEQDHNDARRYILRLIAVCVAALEQHGVAERES